MEPEHTSKKIYKDGLIFSLNQEDLSGISGGVSSTVALPRTSAEPSIQDQTPTEQNKHWSSSVQSLLDQPSAAFPQRLIVGSIVFCFALGTWSWFGQIDEVGTATGRLVPQGETYKIEPVSLGKVTSIAVKEGDEVDAGQQLAQLDTKLVQQQVERFERMLLAYQKELSQKQALIERINLETQTNKAISLAQIQAQESAIAQLEAKISTTRLLLAQLQAESVAYEHRKVLLNPLSALAKKRIEQLEKEAAAHQRRLVRLMPLATEGAISQEFIFQAEQALLQTQQQITQSRMQKLASNDEQMFQAEQSWRSNQTKITQTQGELAAAFQELERLQAELEQKRAQGERMQLEAQQRTQNLEVEITQLQGKITDTESQLVSAQAQREEKFLSSPIDGIILSLNLKNVGKVVQPGQTIAEIAPQDAPLVLSAFLPNTEAGFVEVGMPVKMKLDAYPYQDYGIVSGKVISISADAEADQQLGAGYRLEIALERDYVDERGQKVAFKAGQTATADIIIRRRRIINILLDPFRQMQQGGINM